MNVADQRNAQILIVDDQIANVALLEDVLDEAEYSNIEGFTNPIAAFEFLKNHEVDLVLLDIRMPGMSGLDFLAAMREHPKAVTVPVVVLTAQTDAPTREQALTAGAIDFITKPFDSEEVLKRVHNILNLRHNAKRHAERASSLQEQVDEQTKALRKLSLQELVTGLPNRRAIKQQIHEWLYEGESFVTFFIVIDDMDEIAALHGYGIAEELLKSLGELLSASPISRRGHLGCWGSSEFVLVFPLAQDEEKMSQSARRLLRLLNGDVVVKSYSLKVQARIGMAHSHDLSLASNQERPMDPATVVGLAALALPTANDTGFAHYDETLQEQLLRKNQLRSALRDAIEQNQLNLVFQPKINLNNQTISGVEALARWTDPELGFISPGEFIPLAEQTGDVIALGDWVLETVLKQIITWQENQQFDQPGLDSNFSVAVNVASRQLMQPEFATTLLARIAYYQVDPKRLSIEVTESGLMEDIDLAISQLTRLADAGIQIAIDDFGTGYSSLAYLRNLPMQVLKIDRQFVMELPENKQDARIAETIISMAHSLNCQVVAEGVEHAEQTAILQTMGCEQAQGFFYSRPVPIDALNQLLSKGIRAPEK